MASPNLQLQRERKLRGWSQSYVAKQIEAPEPYYISRWERGEVLPGPFYQQKLCELFGKTAEELGFLQPVDAQPQPQTPKSSAQTTFPTAELPAPTSKGVNPFTYGNPVSEPGRFFGRKLEVEQIFSRLRNAEFESSSIVGERRIGKTSLLKYLAHPAVRQHYGLPADKYLFVYADLQLVDSNTTPVRLWQRLLRLVSNCCSDDEVKQVLEEVYRSPDIDNFALEDVFDCIDAKDLYVVLLLDEFEHVTENANFEAAFFHGLRSMVIQHHLSLITSSRRELIDLCHSQAIRSSPFFNIFSNINIGLFAQDEALNLITRLLAGTGVSFTDSEVDTIFRLAGYHPYFLQVACAFLFDGYSRNMSADERITVLQKALRQEAKPHLTFYWHSSDEHEKILLTALAIQAWQRRSNQANFSMRQLQALYAPASLTLEHLEKRGLALATGDSFSLFNASFAEWIGHEITDIRHNQQSFDEWLASSKHGTQYFKGLPEASRKDLSEMLSRINSEYREMMLVWLAEPKILRLVGEATRSFLSSGGGLSA